MTAREEEYAYARATSAKLRRALEKHRHTDECRDQKEDNGCIDRCNDSWTEAVQDHPVCSDPKKDRECPHFWRGVDRGIAVANAAIQNVMDFGKGRPGSTPMEILAEVCNRIETWRE